MTTYISLLRGINVSGKNIIRMAELREALTPRGFDGIETYIQSGNLIFESSQRSAAAVSKRLAEAITEDFGLEVPVISRTLKAWEDVHGSNPFLETGKEDSKQLAVSFLSKKPSAAGVSAFRERASSKERIEVRGSELFLSLPDGFARTKLDNASLERLLKVQSTTRNWRTVTRLLEMAQGR